MGGTRSAVRGRWQVNAITESAEFPEARRHAVMAADPGK